jgi:hypothetical protein
MSEITDRIASKFEHATLDEFLDAILYKSILTTKSAQTNLKSDL